MNALQLLLERRSHARLTAPAPAGEARSNLFRAAVNVPDHGRLRPWRFITAEGDGLLRLGELLAQAETERGAEPAAIERARQLPLRAPLLVMVIACLQPHDKVPEWEQLAAAACAAHALQMAAFAQGFGAIWRTGHFASAAAVCRGLGLAGQEQLVGFLYVGTPQDLPPAPAQQELSRLVTAL